MNNSLQILPSLAGALFRSDGYAQLPFALLLCLLFCFSPTYAAAGQAEAAARPSRVSTGDDAPAWRNILPGLDVMELKINRQAAAEEAPATLGLSALKNGEHSDMAVLRSDPERFEYTLHMASEDGNRSTLAERARAHGLYAAINAGMYLPDNLKSTGYMRSGTHTNNPRIVSNFGAFFLAGARRPGIPQALLTEKSELGDNIREKIADYDLVIQNYRLVSRKGDLLWPDSAAVYSISALGADKAGNILFIMCEFPLSAPDFARVLRHLPIESGLVMYLEGGSQAGMLLLDRNDAMDASGGTGATATATGRAGREDQGDYLQWRGRHGGFGGIGRPDHVPLPNVLGLKPRS